jgi:DNA-binding beta-propeller fold protein YncE
MPRRAHSPARPRVRLFGILLTLLLGLGSTSLLADGGTSPDKIISTGLVSPQRVASGFGGSIFVADRRAGGILVLELDSGEVTSRILWDGVTSVATAWNGRLLLGSNAGAFVVDHEGNTLLALGSDRGMRHVTDVAADPGRRRYAVLYGRAGRVVVYDSTGSVAFSFGANGDGPGEFKGATAIAINSAGEFFVGDSGHGRIHVFGSSGSLARSFGSFGSGIGEFTQLEDLALDADDNVYTTDSFQSRVQIFDSAGSLLEGVGSFGADLGQFKTPTGLAVAGDVGKLIVASQNTSNLHVFDSSIAGAPVENTTPTIPQPIQPGAGEVLPAGSQVLLEVSNSYDPDPQPLLYEFELYRDDQGVPGLVGTWVLDEERIETTEVDTSAESSQPGQYFWRARASDGIAFSNWTDDQEFGRGAANRPPGTPALQDPVGGGGTPDLLPVLVTQNATDPDGQALTYTFEVARRSGSSLEIVATSQPVAEGAGTTFWAVPATALGPSQEISWRCRASDGQVAGEWSGHESFRTPPFSIPSAAEAGDIPASDRSRPEEARYILEPSQQGADLAFQVYDITAQNELELEVNGFRHPIPIQVNEDWSSSVIITVPAAELDPAQANLLRFLHPGADPWGIRNVRRLSRPALAATPFSTAVDLTWSGPLEGGSPTSVTLYRSADPAGPFSGSGTYAPSHGPVHDTGLANDVTYYYRATYVWSGGTEGQPGAVVEATPATDLGPAPIPDLRLEVDGQDLLLTWTPAVSEPSIAQYEIYSDLMAVQAVDTTDHSNLLATLPATETSYRVIGGLLLEADRWYSVIPVDALGRRALP